MLVARLLGEFEVLRDDKRLTIPTRNAQALFAYLILNAGKVFRREKLAGLLWPDSSEDNARSNLRHELWRLRKALEIDGESYFVVDDLSIAFDPQNPYFLDIHKLEDPPLEASTTDELSAALAVYRGELLPGFYDEWVFLERERLNAVFEAKMARLLEILQGEGRWIEVQDWAMRWIALGQFPEPAYRALMVAYASSGEPAKAIAAYERYAQALQKNLGLKPSEQTRMLYKRLKISGNLGGMVEDTQKSRREMPAENSPLPNVRRSNLPKPLTTFIGREQEIKQVEHMVSANRLVTITGSGGVGKTRLAIRSASELIPKFRDGVWWVELATLNKPTSVEVSESEESAARKATNFGQGSQIAEDLVYQVVAKTLHIPDVPGLPTMEGILEALRGKQLLLVLDNCEHLVEECAALAERLLGECPDVNILATSREGLGVPGESAWLLPSLSLPETVTSLETSRIFESEAVSLFIERAQEVRPDFQIGSAEALTVARICMQLDGIPLAIELAAARIKLLSVQEIADRLDRRFSLLSRGRRTALPRHQTLQAAIEWSYELLSLPEQKLFRRLSVFSGSFSLEAAEAICSDQEVKRDNVLALLGRLVDKSLLNVEPAPQDGTSSTRFHYLDTIRSFGRMKLDETNETNWMHDRHADYYIRLAEAAEPVLLLQDQVRWFKLLQAEYENMRAVIEWSAEQDQAENALRVVVALSTFWWLIGFLREGRDLALKALALPSARQFEEKRAQALSVAGFFQYLHGDIPSSRRLLEEAQSILRSSGDEVHLAWTLQILGLVFAYEKEYALADAADQEGLAIINRIKDLNRKAYLFFFMGDVDLLKGDISRAKNTYEENAALFREMGSKSFLAYPVRRLGYLALEQNDINKARSYFLESLSLNHEVGDIPGMTACLVSAAALAIQLDKPIIAAQLCGAVEYQRDTLAVYALSTDQAEFVHIRGKLQSLLDEETFTAASLEGWYLGIELAIGLAEKVLGGDEV